MKTSLPLVAIIDPVGKKAGMDFYSMNLKNTISEGNRHVFLYSNFRIKGDLSVKNVFRIHSNGRISKFFNLFKGYKQSFTNIKKNGINIIILHLFSFEIKELLVCAIAKMAGLKIIAIVHDVSGFSSKDSSFIRSIIINKWVDCNVVHNNYSRAQIQSISKPKNLHVIKHGNFIGGMMKTYSRQVVINYFDLNSNDIYILFFGQIKKAKGLDVLIKALAFNDNPRMKLIIAGRPWGDDYKSYEELIQKHELHKKVIPIIRYISNDEKDMLFSLSEVVVLPYKEIYQSGVLLMAMSNKIPVIASDLEPFKEVLGEDYPFLFKSENSYDLSRKIKVAIDEPLRLDKLSEQNFYKMKEDYSWVDIGGCYKEIIIALNEN